MKESCTQWTKYPSKSTYLTGLPLVGPLFPATEVEDPPTRVVFRQPFLLPGLLRLLLLFDPFLLPLLLFPLLFFAAAAAALKRD